MFFETTIMGKTADLAMIQKTNIDTLHKEGSHRGSLLKGVAVYRVLYQSILNAKLTGRKNLGRKRCTSNRDDRKLENTVKQSWFKHLGELHKEWTEAEVSASRVTTLRRLQEKGYQATSDPETTSEASYLGCGEKELSGPKSPFQMKLNFAFHLEIKVPESGGRVESRGLHGSKNSYPNPKRPVNMLHGTDPDPYFIWKWDPNPCRPQKCLKCTTRTRRGPDHYSKVGPEPGWEETDPTAPVPIGTYCTANAIKSIKQVVKKITFCLLAAFSLTAMQSSLPINFHPC